MFKQHKFVFNDVFVHLMEIQHFPWEQYLAILNQEEKERLSRFIPERRKKEYVATRFLKEQIFPKTTITYNENGAPQLCNDIYISISHTHNYVGIAYCKTHPVGFDLELIREKVHRVKSKFLHTEESKTLAVDDTETLIKIWSGKEALFKLMGKENVIFGEDLCLFTIENDLWRGQVYHENHTFEVKMRIFAQNDLVIAINTENVQKQK